jgi:N-acetylmuramoyl-L-alanine amidase
MALRIVECRSPNHDARPEDEPIDILVFHYTGMKTADEALARLTDPDAKVSSHYTIDRDGRVFRHVAEERRAWHAGVSSWAGASDVNARSIGIELVNPGHEFGYGPFPKAQISSLIDLADGILGRHPIPPHRVLGHSDVAPARKMDPGELFPWEQLAQFGIGAWPETHYRRDRKAALSIEEAFTRFGYGVAPDMDVPLAAVVTAFQRHFRPAKIDGVVDRETEDRLASLVTTLDR